MNDSTMFINYYQRLLPTIPLVITVVTLIIGFDCIWRLEKKLRRFMIFLTLGIVAMGIRKFIVVINYSDITPLLPYLQYVDIGSTLFFFLGFIQMYKIIRSLDNEIPTKKK